MSDNKIKVNIIDDKIFPNENGKRTNVNITSKNINDFQNIEDNKLDNNKGVLTCLNNTNNIYSLSIRIVNDFTITNNISEKEFIYIIPSTENEKGLFIKNTENIENAEVKYILIIGKLKQELSALSATMSSSDNSQEAPKSALVAIKSNVNTITLDITKVFYILNNKPGVVALDNEEKSKIDNISEYEFLNLYYINYFSFDADSFNGLYNSLKESDKYKSVVPILESAVPDPVSARVAGPASANGGSKLVKKKKKKVN
jgi:hypothetical protein